uniref:Reverse transcriptase/retrotransposon-derived protein RNase H-like domain-containing protein n=1 Tax=Sphaeramia orbicularis TaxID=375764 RepID=A0A673B0L5_9TELE
MNLLFMELQKCPLSWTPCILFFALCSAPVLALPDPTKPSTQTVDEKRGFMSSVLLQAHGDRLRLVAYFSTKLDSVAAGLPSCLCAIAACEKAVAASSGHDQPKLLFDHLMMDFV